MILLNVLGLAEIDAGANKTDTCLVYAPKASVHSREYLAGNTRLSAEYQQAKRE